MHLITAREAGGKLVTTRKPGRYHSLKLGKPDAYAVPDGARETSVVQRMDLLTCVLTRAS